jgi:dTDP-4-dehydrorhamnose reductase
MTGRLLVVGAGGMLGRAWTSVLTREGRAFSACDRAAFDITSREAVRAGIDAHYEAVINCAAWTDVDAAESEESAAALVNGLAPGLLAERCREVGIPLVHFSTDYVFDGVGRAPYGVDAPIAPQNAYGRGKAAGESAVRAGAPEHLIIRTSWVYAPWGKNFVRTIAAAALQRGSLRVVDDQRGRPSSATQLAERVLWLLSRGARGTFHVTDAGECTWFEFASRIAHRVAPSCTVEPCASSAFPRPARRPAYSVLDIAATEAQLGPARHWHDEVDLVLDHLYPRG